VRDNLPPDVQVKDWGEHRLKDLQRPERVYQVIAPDLPTDFPALKTLDNRPNNLPMQRSPLIGREKELLAVQKEVLRSDVGLLTLSGPGGVGKTRLALQAAAELIDHFEDGVFFVPLSTVKDPQLLPITVAQALGVKELPGQQVVDTLKEYLRDKEILVVIDNLEQVISAAPLVADFLSAAPRVKAIATSREALRIYGEREFPVPPLGLPEQGRTISLEALTQYEAVRLFIERARSVKPDFAVTNENAPAVAEICARLDGLPLAIELAAARISILPPAAMLARLQSRLKLLTGGARDLPARQQTLRGALMWSHDLLDAGEQKLFRLLSVFVDGCTLEAVEAVCNAEGTLETDILDGMSSLINKSLLRQVEDERGEPRFTMLETVREYALERLEEKGELNLLQERHGLYYLELVERFGEVVLQGPGGNETIAMLKVIEIEYGNLRAALAWSQQEGGDPEIALRMAAPMEWFYNYAGLYLGEGRRWVEGAIAMASKAPHLKTGKTYAEVTYGAAFLAFLQGDYSNARKWVEETVAILRTIGNDTWLGYGLQLLAMVKGFQGEADREVAEESVRLFRSVGNKWGLAFALFTLGDISLAAGEYERARQEHEESLRSYRAANDLWGSTLPMTSLGRIAWIEGKYDEARKLVEEGLAVRQNPEVANRWLRALSMMSLAEIARCQGMYDESRELAESSLRIFKEGGDRAGEAWSLYNLALLDYYEGEESGAAKAEPVLQEGLALRKEQGNREGMALYVAALAQVWASNEAGGSFRGGNGNARDERAARLFGLVDAMFTARVARLSPADRAIYDRDKANLRASLGEAAFDKAYLEGQAMSLEDGVNQVLSRS
jgi:predicted ATPase